jgi:hypothetical protein
MLNPWKHVMVEYKALIVKTHFDQKKAKYACENIELLCDLIMVIDFFGALKSVGKPPWVGCCQN